MKVLVCGHRNCRDRDLVWRTLDAIHAETPIAQVIHGAASGADLMGGWWARDRGVEIRKFPARWNDIEAPGAVIRRGPHGVYNANAGPTRNTKMLVEGKPDMVVAFVDRARAGGTPGTNDMLGKARGLKANGASIKIVVVPA